MPGFSDVRTVRLAGLCLAACVALVLSRLFDADLPGIVFKAMASTAFVGVAWLSGVRESRYGQIILAGLGLSWFGDMFLLGESPAMFLAGLVSFLLAHVAYVLAFAHLGTSGRWIAGAVPLIGVCSLAAMLWLGPSLPADMALPVHIYTVVISVMVIVAYGAFGRGASWIVPAGATLFYLSDLSVAALQFTDPDYPVYVLGLPFYYTGQLLLAASIRFQIKKD